MIHDSSKVCYYLRVGECCSEQRLSLYFIPNIFAAHNLPRFISHWCHLCPLAADTAKHKVPRLNLAIFFEFKVFLSLLFAYFGSNLLISLSIITGNLGKKAP